MEQKVKAMKENNTPKKKLIPFIFVLIISFVSCTSARIPEVKFSYRSMIDKEYRFNIGRVFPVTISQSVETDGDISKDSSLFFYTSDSASGNYDIYVRAMGDITTVRLTSHPSRDVSPVISPDKKRLAFVSYRDDPYGDIFIVKEDFVKLLNEAAEGREVATIDERCTNITAEEDPISGITKNIRDINPSWSPDGKLIAFSSNRSGRSEIWIMEDDGKSKRQLSSNTGDYPSFSPDGKKIIYISYGENSYGDIFTIDLTSGKTTRLTNDKTIKLYPSFTSDENVVIYTSIEKDTNHNGILDLNDNSIIRSINIKNMQSYQLTKSSDSAFKAKWLPVLDTTDYKGIILFSDISSGNVNLNLIAETGIIPKKNNARLQYELCETYLNEYDDEERYIMALESVYKFFGDSKDKSSVAYTDRALKDAVIFYETKKDPAKDKIISLLKKREKNGDKYSAALLKLIETKNVTEARDILEKEQNSEFFLPFLSEDIAYIFLDKGEKALAIKTFEEILKKYPSFERKKDIQTELGILTDDITKGFISEHSVEIIKTGTTNQKIAVTANLISQSENKNFSLKEFNFLVDRINLLKEKFPSDKDNKKVQAILSYSMANIYLSQKKENSAINNFKEAINLSHPNDLVYYSANINLGEIFKKQLKYDEAEEFYSAAINRYSRRFKTKNFKEKLLWLINYYETKGLELFLNKNYEKAESIYSKYINLVTLVHNKKLYPDIYKQYGARAHVLYIETLSKWKGLDGINGAESSYNTKLPVLRMDLDRAAIYGLAYIYAQKGHMLDLENNLIESSDKEEVYKNFFMADKQIEWALFLDDTFIESYLLKSWIYQYVDLKRKEYGDDIEKSIKNYFSKELWEKNIQLLEKALAANDENSNPEQEGNIHLNIGNNYFLLLNYPRALYHYRLAEKYKKNFNSSYEKAIFHFHYGYCLWQNNLLSEAKEEISKAYLIYSKISEKNKTKYIDQQLLFCRYFALFERYSQNYREAIKWFEKIIDLADKNNLSIDRARILQEMAFCYKELGEREKTISYIEQAEKLLEKYPDDTKKYNLKIKLFGIGPFPVWDMGQDTAVIGDNKIFYPLDTKNKKLLNLSLREEIALSENNYKSAIDYLDKKIKLLEKSRDSVSLETKIRSLNNIGYYYYILESYRDCEKNFNSALDIALATNNLEGIFTATKNLTNLYMFLIEEGYTDRNWLKEIESLIKKTENYKNNYYTTKLEQEKAALNAKAKKEKREVTPVQIKDLEERIEKETSQVYSRLEISIALLNFYKAELLSHQQITDKTLPLSIYKDNISIYSLYADSADRLQKAIAIADKENQKELKIKLLINLSLCYEAIGEVEKSYICLIDAQKLAEQLKLQWLKINSMAALGRFVAIYGKEVESGDYRALAEKYMVAAINQLEDNLKEYKKYKSKISAIYKNLEDFYIKNGNNIKANSIKARYEKAMKQLY